MGEALGGRAPYWNLVPPNEKRTAVEKLAKASLLAVNLVVIVNCNGTGFVRTCQTEHFGSSTEVTRRPQYASYARHHKVLFSVRVCLLSTQQTSRTLLSSMV